MMHTLPNGQPVPELRLEGEPLEAIFSCGCRVGRSYAKSDCTNCPAALTPCQAHGYEQGPAMMHVRAMLRELGATAAALELLGEPQHISQEIKRAAPMGQGNPWEHRNIGQR